MFNLLALGAIPKYAYLTAAAVGVLLIVAAVAYHGGRDDERDKIEDEAATTATDALDARLQRAQCRLDGGVWDFAANECIGAD